MRIAVTGVGTATGEALVRDVRRCLPDAWILGLDVNPWAPGLYLCDAQDRLPYWDAPEYADALEALVHRWGLEVVLPGLDLELEPLALARERMRAQGCTVIVAEAEAVALCHDKLRCAREMRAHGLAFVETLSMEEWREDPTRLAPPFIVKPRFGSGSKGVRLILDATAAGTLADPDLVFQPYLVPVSWGLPEGASPTAAQVWLPDGSLNQADEIAVQGVLGPDGGVVGSYTTRNHLLRGFPIRHIPVDPAPLQREAEAMLAFLGQRGMRGCCNLQGRLTAQGFQVYEVNPRFTAGTAGRAGMGFEEVLACIRLLHTGDPAGMVAPLLQGRMDRICLKVAQEVFVDRDRLEP